MKKRLWGFQPGSTQTGLYNHRRWLEAVISDLRCGGSCLFDDNRKTRFVSSLLKPIVGGILMSSHSMYEPRREKTGFLHMRKQRRRSALR